MQSKLTLLAAKFPKLRIIWSSTPAATAEIFEELKKTELEPDIDVALQKGVASDSVANPQVKLDVKYQSSTMVSCLPMIPS